LNGYFNNHNRAIHRRQAIYRWFHLITLAVTPECIAVLTLAHTTMPLTFKSARAPHGIAPNRDGCGEGESREE
ncbi:MAG: hypothetical protein ACRDC8_15610, partial [Aeromonas veronii]